jgi:hypothetical protein
MKILVPFLTATGLLAAVGCMTQRQGAGGDRSSLMQLDSSYTNNSNVIVVRPNAPIRIAESSKDTGNSSGLMQTDIDAVEKRTSPGVQYLKEGETIRISEPTPPGNR